MTVSLTGFELLADFEELDSITVDQITRVVEICFINHSDISAHLELCFMKEPQHCDAHQQFLNNSAPTDVMSFPYGDDDCFGELLINVEMAIRRAPEFSHSAVIELMLYIVHGTLHLLGFDDYQPSDIKKMRQAESEIMAQASSENVF
ncbi:MAG: rRNA maturation RNase YbeY, partial [Planctomycetota bacterium]|nr:rRNA maturation RNase YbeY [Planctomycetota bacterium]